MLCACAQRHIAGRPFPSYSLKVNPVDHFINWQQDPLQQSSCKACLPTKTTEFSVEVDLVADMTVINPFDFFLEKYAEEIPFQYDPVVRRELIPYLKRRRVGPKWRS